MTMTPIIETYITGDGEPCRGHVLLSLAVDAYHTGLDKVVKKNPPIRVNLDDNGSISVSLHPTAGDDAEWLLDEDEILTYRVEEYVVDTYGNPRPKRVYYVVVPSSASPVKLGELATYANAPSIIGNQDLAAEWVAWQASAASSFGVGVYNVKNYGATGDGTTDDYDAIRDAIDAMPAAGGTLFFPAGIYRVRATVSIDKPCTVEGSGPYVTILRPLASLTSTVLQTDESGVTIRGLSIRGNTGAGTYADGLTVTNPRGWFSDLYLYECDKGLVVDGGASQAHANTFTNIKAIDCRDYGVYISSNSAYDQQFLNLWIGNCSLDSLQGGLFIDDANTTITNLHVWGCRGNGITVRANNTRIVNAYIETNFNNGIDFYQSYGLRVVNGYFWYNGNAGANIQTSSKAFFTDCTFLNQGTSGVNANDSTDCMVHNSYFYDDQVSKTQDRPILTTGSSDYWVVNGNIMRATDHATGAASLAGLNNVVANNVE